MFGIVKPKRLGALDFAGLGRDPGPNLSMDAAQAARIMDDAITPLEVSFEKKGAGIRPIVAEDNLEFQPLEEGEGGSIGSN